MKRLILLIALLGCGGGGGGGSEDLSFNGRWSGFLEQLVDVCKANGLGDRDFAFTVSQSGSTVVVEAGTLVLAGTANDSDLAATGSEPSDCDGEPGTVATRIDFLRGNGSGFEADRVAAILTLDSTCGAATVECKWSGVMAR